jgi:DNA-binding transcriptional regulator YhcF (GntR family)
MILNEKSAVAKYIQIAEYYRRKIIMGELKDGDTLPSKRELTETEHISMSTVNLAYDELVSDGYVVLMNKRYCVCSKPRNIVERTKAAISKLMIEARKHGLTESDINEIVDIVRNKRKPY